MGLGKGLLADPPLDSGLDPLPPPLRGVGVPSASERPCKREVLAVKSGQHSSHRPFPLCCVEGGVLTAVPEGILKVFLVQGKCGNCTCTCNRAKSTDKWCYEKTAIYNAHPQEVKNITLSETPKK